MTRRLALLESQRSDKLPYTKVQDQLIRALRIGLQDFKRRDLSKMARLLALFCRKTPQ